ncbi:MAG: mechanosensitive ion channel family protein [Candidatus Caldatribacterium sp.]|nr:mechanosensitive ion channel family protein [Candidatus Caldatribacterium sp.]MCX7730931.1 mechanosensitive ion channel family protein [Candidatus Caldatribacterium sp.]MDW8081439.1 mechanosensitive ion channel family protein [Candidatus Calescibacterium sp.]
MRFETSGVILRVMIEVPPKHHWDVEQDLLYEIKKAFDAAHIGVPYPKYVITLKN